LEPLLSESNGRDSAGEDTEGDDTVESTPGGMSVIGIEGRVVTLVDFVVELLLAFPGLYM
jgi:hypothetical protein